MADTLTHIAGVRLNVCGRIIQRCSLCGAKLCDSDGASMPVPPEYEGFSNDEKLKWFDDNFSSWPVSRLVQIDAGNPTRSSLLPDDDRLPKDSCIEFS
jgi:hypothetical protein